MRIRCPFCRAEPGQRCIVAATGAPLRQPPYYHPSRIDAADAAQADEISRRREISAAVPLCRVCGAHALLAIHEAARGVCDWCAPAVNQPQPDGDKSTGTA